jgi:hypothetical protein
MIASERKHRYWQIALRRESLVIDRILIEGRELIKGRMHGARSRIELCVVTSRLFVNRLWIGGEFVIETIEIDALASNWLAAPGQQWIVPVTVEYSK